MDISRGGGRTMAGALLSGSLFLLTGLISGEPALAGDLRVLTYNAHWTEQTDARTGRWTNKLNARAIARDVRRSGAEVVALQELQTYRIRGRVVSQAAILAQTAWVDHARDSPPCPLPQRQSRGGLVSPQGEVGPQAHQRPIRHLLGARRCDPQ